MKNPPDSSNQQDIASTIHGLIKNAETLQKTGTPKTYHPFLLNLHDTIKVVLTHRFWQHLASLSVEKQKEAFDKYMSILCVDDVNPLEKWGEILFHCGGGLTKDDVDTLMSLDKEYAMVSSQEDGSYRINPDSNLCDRSLALTKQLGFLPETKASTPIRPSTSVDFRATFVLVNLQKWRDRKNGSPFYKKTLFYSGCEIPAFDVYDEATIVTHRSVDGYDKPSFIFEMKTSGVQCLDPLLPTDHEIETDTYRRDGRIQAKIPVLSKELNYAKKTWNGFQGLEQNFEVATDLGSSTDLLLAVDFSAIMGIAEFKELPSAWLEGMHAFRTSPVNVHIVRSTDSSLWFARVAPDNSNPDKRYKLKIKWDLCEPSEDENVYIFSYASLLSADQISGTLGRKINQEDLRATVLHNYRREWTAFNPITTKCMGDIDADFHPEHIAYANVHPIEGASCNGILFKIKRDELELFDARERNYCRVNVTELIEGDIDKPVYTYSSIPKNPLNEYSKRAFIRKDYIDLIEHSLGSFDESFRREYWNLFDNPADIPICDAYPVSEKARYKF